MSSFKRSQARNQAHQSLALGGPATRVPIQFHLLKLSRENIIRAYPERKIELEFHHGRSSRKQSNIFNEIVIFGHAPIGCTRCFQHEDIIVKGLKRLSSTTYFDRYHSLSNG